jgi:multiple sugar transport system substrate-binding protein
VIQAAEKIKQKEPDVTPLQIDAGTAMQEASLMQGLYPLTLGAGNFIYDYKTNKYVAKSPGMLQALELYKSIYIDKKVGNLDLQLAQNGRNQSFADFRDGKIGIYLESDYIWRTVLKGGQYALPNRDQLVGYAKIPAVAPGKGYRGQSFVNMSGGTGWVINPNSKAPDLVWELMATMYSQEGDQKWESIQPVIPLRSDVTVPNDETMTSLAKLLPLTVVRPNVTSYPQVAQLLEQATSNVITGQMSPQQAQDAYADQLTKAVGSGGVETLNKAQAG